MSKRRETIQAKTLAFIRKNPGCLAEDIKVALRVSMQLRELELAGKIEYRGERWYIKET